MDNPTSFTGQHMPNVISRTISSPDPANPTRILKTRKRFDLITNLRLQRVSGSGHADKTGEPFITVSGQFGPFATARITASAQNMEPLRKMLEGHVEATDPRLIKIPMVVDVVVSPMKGFGFAVQELYLHGEDGKKTAIIAPVGESIESTDIDSVKF